MRRRSWEEKGGGGDDQDDLDHPVTLTEKQLRSLERNARFGLFGLILALVALALAGYTMFRAPKKAVNEPQTVAATSPAAAADSAAAHPPALTTTPPSAAPSAAAPPAAAATRVASARTGGPAAVIPKARTHSVHASNAATGKGSRRTRSASHASGAAPKMESFDPAPAPAAAAPPAASVPTPLPTPVPAPVPVAHKPAVADTSHH